MYMAALLLSSKIARISIKKLIKQVGMVVQKKYTNKSSRESNKVHPEFIFMETLLLENKVEGAYCLLFSLLLLFAYFFCTTIPTCFIKTIILV